MRRGYHPSQADNKPDSRKGQSGVFSVGNRGQKSGKREKKTEGDEEEKKKEDH